MIHSDISGEMVHCANLPQNLCKTAANRSPLQPRYARQLPPKEAFGSCVTAYHSTYLACYPAWAGRLSASRPRLDNKPGPLNGKMFRNFPPGGKLARLKVVTDEGWQHSKYGIQSGEWFQLHCRGGYYPPACEALSVRPPLNGIHERLPPRPSLGGRCPGLPGRKRAAGCNDSFRYLGRNGTLCEFAAESV